MRGAGESVSVTYCCRNCMTGAGTGTSRTFPPFTRIPRKPHSPYSCPTLSVAT